jgi:hypothetical protein
MTWLFQDPLSNRCDLKQAFPETIAFVEVLTSTSSDLLSKIDVFKSGFAEALHIIVVLGLHIYKALEAHIILQFP